MTKTTKRDDAASVPPRPGWANPSVGYRDEALYGSGVRDPLEVAAYEVGELLNTDIPRHVMRHAGFFLADADPRDREAIRLCAERTSADLLGPSRLAEALDALRRVLRDALDGRDFAVWLCETPTDVFDNYVEPYPETTDMTHADRRDAMDVWRYEVPDDAVTLCDGPEGTLVAWRSDEAPTEGVECIDMTREVPLKEVWRHVVYDMDDPDRCPVCDGDITDESDLTDEGNVLWRTATCAACGARLSFRFELVACTAEVKVTEQE